MIAPPAEVVALLNDYQHVIEACGSQVTCDPPPGNGADYDFLVELTCNPIQSIVSDIVNALWEHGWKWEGSEHYQQEINHFMSWRKDNVNLIVTTDADFARRHRAATSVCRRLNLSKKDDRVALFQAVLYGNGS